MDKTRLNAAILRVSTKGQDVNSQALGVDAYIAAKGIGDVEVIELKVSATKTKVRDRGMYALLDRCAPGSRLIFAEVSRLGRTTTECLQFIQAAIDAGVELHISKRGLVFDDSMGSKIMATVLSLVAELETMMISERTVEGLERARAEGKRLGRPPGATSINPELLSKKAEIKRLLDAGLPYTSIGKLVGKNRKTVAKFVGQVFPGYVDKSA